MDEQGQVAIPMKNLSQVMDEQTCATIHLFIVKIVGANEYLVRLKSHYSM